MKVIAIAGSLRAESLNRALIQAAVELAPESMNIRVFDLAGIPFYNGDLDKPELWPTEVLGFAEAIRQSDAVLISTPEYNHTVPGVLVNALDWASRPLGSQGPLRGKPAVVIGASPGLIGTARAQEHLKLALMNIGAHVLSGLGLVVGRAFPKFTDGRLSDPETRERLARLLVSLEVAVGHPVALN